MKSLVINDSFPMLAGPVKSSGVASVMFGRRVLHIPAKRSRRQSPFDRAWRSPWRSLALPSAAAPASACRVGEGTTGRLAAARDHGEADPRQRHRRRPGRPVGLGNRPRAPIASAPPGPRLRRRLDQPRTPARPAPYSPEPRRGARTTASAARSPPPSTTPAASAAIAARRAARTDGRWQLAASSPDDAALS